MGCSGQTNFLVKTCELTRRAFVWCQGAQQVPRLPPDFLSGLVASVNFMRLSLKKAAYVAVWESSVVGNPEFARDDKVEVGGPPGHLRRWMDKVNQRPDLPHQKLIWTSMILSRP
jgi:hypothetical protein